LRIKHSPKLFQECQVICKYGYTATKASTPVGKQNYFSPLNYSFLFSNIENPTIMSTTKRTLCMILALGFFSLFSAKAQSDISDLFKSGVNDLQTLANGYIKPFGYGFSAGLGNNWYNTAATHKVLGFDITVGASGVFTPSSDKTFSLSGLQKLTAVNSSDKTAPTFGGKGDGVDLILRQTVNGTSQTITQFRTPKGVSRVTPVPSFQVTLGLPPWQRPVGSFHSKHQRR
jgi:hypothetical protein